MDKNASEADEMPSHKRIREFNEPMKRESSPEMARICALITRPPKQKSSHKRTFGACGYGHISNHFSLLCHYLCFVCV